MIRCELRTRPSVTLYGHSYCQLCEEMQNELLRLQQQHEFDWIVVDIHDDRKLEDRFGERVPVLVAECGTEICYGSLDFESLGRFLL